MLPTGLSITGLRGDIGIFARHCRCPRSTCIAFTSIDEDKILPTQRVLLHLVLNQHTQAVEKLAHIGGLSVQPDTCLTARDKHQC